MVTRAHLSSHDIVQNVQGCIVHIDKNKILCLHTFAQLCCKDRYCTYSTHLHKTVLWNKEFNKLFLLTAVVVVKPDFV